MQLNGSGLFSILVVGILIYFIYLLLLQPASRGYSSYFGSMFVC